MLSWKTRKWFLINLDRFFCWFVLEWSFDEDEDDDDEDDDDDDEDDDDEDLDDLDDELAERLLPIFCCFSLLREFFSFWLLLIVPKRWGRSLENLYVFFVL